MALPDCTKPFTLQTGASGIGMGDALLQHGHPISYFSRKLYFKLHHSSTYVCELHAITIDVQKWRHYLLGNQFTTETDQKSLGINELGYSDTSSTLQSFKTPRL